jgi:lysophospholipase L1-like esterase
MLKTLFQAFFVVLPLSVVSAQDAAAPAWPAELAAYQLVPAPPQTQKWLQAGDRLAICGDSITEQKQYSVIIETYLTACLPEMEITCRQYGWSGEQAAGFLKRIANDVLRFKPTLATTCYGMNDFRYVPYDEAIAAEYRKNQTAIARLFKENKCRVILGSSGIIDSVPHWVKSAKGTQRDLNLALSRFRNITVETSISESAGFADIYQPMLLADLHAKKIHGPEFKVAGKDGVHPGWAGQVIMAHAFLKAMGVDGDLGTITWDAASDKAAARGGHEITNCGQGKISILSKRLPFSPGPGDVKSDASIRAGLALVPFDEDLNRFTLKITQASAPNYQVTWGNISKTFPAAQLVSGISLAREFEDHPLLPAFKHVWSAVEAKQAYETRQIKTLIHGPEGDADMEGTFAVTEKARGKLAAAVRDSLKPVNHEITIVAVP